MPLIYKRRYTHRDNEGCIRARATTDVNGQPVSRDAGVIDFDVVTELVFKDQAAHEAWATAIGRNGGGEKVVADEEKFLDRGRTRAQVVEEFVTCPFMRES